MQIYEIVIRNRAIVPNSSDMTLVRTSVGIDQLHILFADLEWIEFPVSITFAQGDVIVTNSIVVSETPESSQYVAEAYVTIPYEVIEMVGSIRVTLQGVDSRGRHIITAKGAPLSVEEAGDVVDGEPPDGNPQASQWQQAYADALEVTNQAASLVSNLQSRLDAMVDNARASLDDAIASAVTPATRSSLGTVIVGDGLGISESGEIYVTAMSGMTTEQVAQLSNLARLAAYCFDTEFDSDGTLLDTVKIKRAVLPVATLTGLGAVMPDGSSIVVADDGLMSAT